MTADRSEVERKAELWDRVAEYAARSYVTTSLLGDYVRQLATEDGNNDPRSD